MEKAAEQSMHSSMAAEADSDDDTESDKEDDDEDEEDDEVDIGSDDAPVPHCKKSVKVGERGTKRSAPPEIGGRKHEKKNQ